MFGSVNMVFSLNLLKETNKQRRQARLYSLLLVPTVATEIVKMASLASKIGLSW